MARIVVSLVVSAGCLLLSSCSKESRQTGEPAPDAKDSVRTDAPGFRVEEDESYVVTVWKTDRKTQGPTIERAKAKLGQVQAQSTLLLRCHDSEAVVLITAWDSDASASQHAEEIEDRGDRTRVFEAISQSKKPDAPTAIVPESRVQWSEFLMRDPKQRPILSATVTAMTGAMAEFGGAEDLRLIHQLRSMDDRSIGLLGVWSTRGGFAEFERKGTWGEEGYWEPFADNEHWMCEVELLVPLRSAERT